MNESIMVDNNTDVMHLSMTEEPMLFLHDISGRITSVNSFTTSMLGFSSEELEGTLIQSLLAVDQPFSLGELLSELREHGVATRTFEIVGKKMENRRKIFLVEARAWLVPSNERQVVLLSCMIQSMGEYV
ncbi:MAG: PAS domain-containing protein [Candidatus Marinimicrobia bacterium]|nr:PAS domain-containing protein [Candidatus Neomarinimicrobiota bacterium]